MGREADSGVLSGASCPPPPCREDELKSEGLRVHLLVFPWPQPEARGEKKGPASGLGIVSPRGTFIWQLLPHPHPEYLEVSPCPALLPSRAQMGSGFYLGILTTRPSSPALSGHPWSLLALYRDPENSWEEGCSWKDAVAGWTPNLTPGISIPRHRAFVSPDILFIPLTSPFLSSLSPASTCKEVLLKI